LIAFATAIRSSAPKTESISLRVSADIKKAVERGALSKQQTVAGFVEQVLIQGLLAMGYLRERTNSTQIRIASTFGMV
jgi:hypothetical protein